MEYDENLAEIIGIMLGDGCLHKLKHKNSFQTIICFNKLEKEYLFYVKDLFESYFNYSFAINEIKCEFLLRNSSVYVGTKLIEYGLIPGNKVANKVTIPNWILNNRNYLLRTVRGFFDTDGCVYRKYDNYAQIHFKFGSFELTESLHSAITLLDFNPTKIEKGFNKAKNVWFWKFYLVRQKEITSFFEKISPKNTKHVLRYKNIKNGDAGTFTQKF